MKAKRILHVTLITAAVILLCFHYASAQNSFPTPTGACELDATGAGAGSTGQIRFLELNANGSNYIGLKAPDAISVNQVYVLPAFPSGVGKVLTSDASGILSWTKRVKTDMSNLDPTTSINSSLVPNASNTLDLGAATFPWRNGYFLGSVGIGITSPETKLHISGGSDASLASDGYLVLGSTTSTNIVFDNDEIMARNNGAAHTLFLQTDGGDCSVCAGALFVKGSTEVVSTSTDLNVGGKLDVATHILLGDGILNSNNGDITMHPNVCPDTDCSHTLGRSDLRWDAVWACDGTINTSDARDKTNVKDISYGLDAVLELRPVTFEWRNCPADGGIRLGLIAQELQNVLPEVVRDWEWTGDENTGRIKVPSQRLGVMYDAIIPVLVKAMQEQHTIVEEKDSKIDNQQQQIIQLTDRVAALEAAVSQPASTDGTARFTLAADTKPVLGQNVPNPFDNTTLIPFRLPKNCKDASLRIIETTTGSILRVIAVTCGETEISINAGELASGNYTYSLYVDGSLIDTKQMILTK